MYERPVMPWSVATSISTSGAASMTPKAFFTGREIGATTARALMLRMVAVVALIMVSSLDTVPPHEAGRRPVRCGGLDQPAPGMFGGEGDALGLTWFDRQRIQPERLPAVVEPVQQPEMMSMQVEHGRDLGAVRQRQHYGSARLGAEGGHSRFCEIQGRYPVGLWSAQRQIGTHGVFEVELGRQAVGGQRSGGRQRRVPDRWLIGDDQPRDRAGLFAIMQKNR